MPEIISKGAFAIRCGRMPSAVSNWIARGQLTGAALTADGKILVEEAERQLGRAVDPGRGREPSAQIIELRPSAGGDEPTLAQVRLAREKLLLDAQERQAALERGELVRADEVARLWASELNDLLLAIDQFVVDLPPKLGLGRDAIDIARREWREFRRRRAEQAAAASGNDDAA